MDRGATFKKLSLAILVYCILVILWGAYVRISGSGNGCGEHWPLCEGHLIPTSTTLKTWIEFFHRVKSGVFAFLILGQWMVARCWYPRIHPVRTLTKFSLLFTVFESLLGAALVLGGYVAIDSSVKRLFVMSLHLLNTLFLVGSLSLVWDYALAPPGNFFLPLPKKKLPLAAMVIMIACTGAWASLSTTLFPSTSLTSGLSEDFSTLSHLFVRLRFIHPFLAMVFGGLIYFYCSKLEENQWKSYFQLLLGAQLVIGSATLLLLSPFFLKVLHLLTAELTWIVLVLYLMGNKRSETGRIEGF